MLPLPTVTPNSLFMEVVTFALAVFVPLILAGASSARELRPSDHGLTFQTFSPAGPHSSPEMRSFFNSADSSPSMSSSSSDVALPRAMDSGDASPPEWWQPVRGHSGKGLGKALTVASLACGVAGAVLLVASGLIYLFKNRNRNRKQKLNAAFCGENENEGGNDEDNNKLQLVVRNP